MFGFFCASIIAVVRSTTFNLSFSERSPYPCMNKSLRLQVWRTNWSTTVSFNFFSSLLNESHKLSKPVSGFLSFEITARAPLVTVEGCFMSYIITLFTVSSLTCSEIFWLSVSAFHSKLSSYICPLLLILTLASKTAPSSTISGA